MRCVALLLLVVAVGGCRTSREERITEWLQDRNMSEVRLMQKGRLKWDFVAQKQGIDCDGTATITELTRGYHTREKVNATWHCGE